jgi:hypothetical protein
MEHVSIVGLLLVMGVPMEEKFSFVPQAVLRVTVFLKAITLSEIREMAHENGSPQELFPIEGLNGLKVVQPMPEGLGILPVVPRVNRVVVSRDQMLGSRTTLNPVQGVLAPID